MNEIQSWATSQLRMVGFKEDMDEAIKTENMPAFYKLKNEAILARITSQMEMLNLVSNRPLDIVTQEKIQKLLLQLTPLKQQAEDRKPFEESQFSNPQIQKAINDEFKEINNLLNKIQNQSKEMFSCEKKPNPVTLAENGQIYLWSDETHCHNPECGETKFTRNLKKCAGCKSVLYCSKECQKTDWTAHKLSCKPIKTGK